MKAGKIIRNSLIGLVALVLVLLVALQVLLRPQVLTGIVNRIAADYVEGDVSFREVKAHVIKSFPFLNVEAQDFAITYPHSRYARYDSLYPDTQRRFSLLKMGWQRGVENGQDTLASFRRLQVSVDYKAFLQKKGIHVHRLELERPRIFAHYYDSTAANWDILPIGREEDAPDSSGKKPLPPIRVNKISLTDRPLIVFTDPEDTLHGMFTLRRLMLDGQVDTEHPEQVDARLRLDSMLVSGRLPQDTLSLRLHSLQAHVQQRDVQLEARADARLRTGSFGRVKLPVQLDADLSFPQREEGALEVLARSLHLGVSSLHLNGRGDVVRHPDGLLDLDVEASVKDCPLGELLDEFENNFPLLKKVNTRAILSMDAQVKGPWGPERRPAVNARLLVPPATVDYEGLGRKGRLGVDAVVRTDDMQEVNAEVKRLFVDIAGAKVDASARVKDALGKDPLITLDGKARARVDSLTRLFTLEKGITGTGSVDLQLSGRVRKSQLSMARIGNASLNADLNANGLSLTAEKDSLYALLPTLAVNLSTQANQINRNLKKGTRVLALKADADTLNVSFKDMFVRGGGIHLLAQNSAEILKGGKELTPLIGLLRVGNLQLRDSEGMSVTLKKNTESFRITPVTREQPVPRLSLRSSSEQARGRLGANMMSFQDLKFDLAASRHTRRPRNAARRNQLLDSLQRVYPGVPRDSLLARARAARMRGVSQDDFAAADVRISLSSALQQYARNWDLEGNLNLGGAHLTMPSFPLPTSLSDVRGSFDNDTLDLKNITVLAGGSDVSAQARLTGLRRAIAGSTRSRLKLKADVRSNYLDANELLRGYAYYSTYVPHEEDSVAVLPELPDSAVQRKLLVIPSNLEVDFSLEASGIHYDSLEINWAAADVAMRNRTIQITNALAASNMGDIYFEGFYATRSKQDIKAGFDLNLVDITAEKVITLFPAVDTLMPMLSTFAGDLDCELAVTTDIDTLMNVVLPSVDGVMRISGKDLSLNESQELSKIAGMLMFRNRKEAHIDNMSVTGIIQDNVLEIFPFLLKVDRYQLAASGMQHLTKEFDYHISVLKSPLLVKFGLNAWGPDFDNIHYGVGKAKYRSANIPVYTKELDNVQYSLVGAIHNIFELGVEKAMEENRTGQYFTVEAPSGSPQESVSLQHLEQMGTLVDNMAEDVMSRREALKQEILRLEAEAAAKP